MLTCGVCDKTFRCSPSEIKFGRKYCSIDCYNKVRAKKKPSKQLLQELYITKLMSTIKIGKLLNIDTKTVYYWLKKHSIHIRSRSEAGKIQKPAMSKEARRRIGNACRKRWANPEYKKKMIKELKSRKHSKEAKRKISASLKGNKYRKGIPHTEQDKKKISEASKKLWKNPEYAKKILKTLNRKPNQSEMKVVRLIKKHNLLLRYVGDGKLLIDGKCPDFVSTINNKKLVELFGEPWHDPTHSKKIDVNYDRTEKGRVEFFKKRGYDCLILWDDELHNEAKVVEKINAFTHQHIQLYEELL